MWIDDTDLTQLAQRLRVGPRELIEAIGGPWRSALRPPDAEDGLPGTLFVGRAGPSTAILLEEAVPRVIVGRAEGRWHGVTTLQWMLTHPSASIEVPATGAPSAEIDGFVSALGRSVEAAFADARSMLVLCRYCGTLVAPALCVGDELCSACGSRIFGIVY